MSALGVEKKVLERGVVPVDAAVLEATKRTALTWNESTSCLTVASF